VKFKYSFSKNNLDLLRLMLASLVVILHLSDITGDALISNYSVFFEFLSSRAVSGFFIVSGFLIYMSYEKSHSLVDYYWKRFLRIFPAYFILIMGFSIFLFFQSEFDARSYFSYDLFDYIFFNLIFLNFISPELPGVFSDSLIKAVNGSLWTLKIEVMFYIMVPLLYKISSKFNPLLVMFSVFIMSVVYVEILNGLYLDTGNGFYHKLSYQLPGQLMYFVSGILAYLYYGFIKKYSLYFLVMAICIFYFNIVMVDALALTVFLIFLFMFLPFSFDFSKIGDLSYGVYIFHFPIIQILVSSNYLIDSPKILIFVTYLITFIMAFISWHAVEKKFLLLKDKFKIIEYPLSKK